MTDNVKLGDDLIAIQEVGIANLSNLGIKNLSANRIGNYKTGEPDGVMGPGTHSFLEQLLKIAQKDAGVAIVDLSEDFSRHNMALIERYMEKQNVKPEEISKFMTALTALHKPEDGPSDFSKGFATLTKPNPWRVLAADLSPPIVTMGRRDDGTERRTPTEVRRDFAQAAPPAPPAAADPIQPAVHRPGSSGAVAPAVYSPETITRMTMTHAQFADIKQKSHPSDLDKAKMAAFNEAYTTALKAAGYDKVQADYKAQLAIKANPDAALQKADTTRHAEKTKLDGIDQKIKDTKVELIVNGEKHTTTMGAALSSLGFMAAFDTKEEAAFRKAAEAKYAELKDSMGYNKQKIVTDTAQYAFMNFGRNNQAEIERLGKEMARIEQSVKAQKLTIGIPNEIIEASRPPMMAGGTPSSTATRPGA